MSAPSLSSWVLEPFLFEHYPSDCHNGPILCQPLMIIIIIRNVFLKRNKNAVGEKVKGWKEGGGMSIPPEVHPKQSCLIDNKSNGPHILVVSFFNH